MKKDAQERKEMQLVHNAISNRAVKKGLHI
jgi:hypothetical protein